MRVELDLDNDKDGKIYHGMYGQVTIVLKRERSSSPFPRRASPARSKTARDRST